MELRQLRYFVAVAEELHFHRASRRLHMAQSPLSRQVKQLEDDLGVKLLHRTNRRVALTQAGALFLEEARAVLAATERARRTASRAEAGKLGRLSLGFTNFAAYTIFPTLLRRYRTSFPDIELSLEMNALTPWQVDALGSGELDVGVIRPPLDQGELALLPISRDSLVVALPADHALAAHDAIAARDLADLPFVMFSRKIGSSLSEAIVGTCRDAGFDPRIAHEVGDIATILLLVSAGEGVSLVPGLSRKFGLADVAFRPLKDASPDLTIALAWNAATASPVRDAFVDLARSVAAEVAFDQGR